MAKSTKVGKGNLDHLGSLAKPKEERKRKRIPTLHQLRGASHDPHNANFSKNGPVWSRPR